MADQRANPNIAALRKLEASLRADMRLPSPGQNKPQAHFRQANAPQTKPNPAKPDAAKPNAAKPNPAKPDAAPRSSRLPSWNLAFLNLGSCKQHLHSICWQLFVSCWWMRLRKVTYVSGVLASVGLIAMFGLWWRLSHGPIEIGLVTPWLTAAIEENFGSQHHVDVGGTQLELDANGRTAVRLRDIVVRDADGTVVASAPKAEIGVSSADLIAGRFHAQRLSLVDAAVTVRIEQDSKVTVFAGATKRPFVTASAAEIPVRIGPKGNLERAAATPTPALPPTVRNGFPDFVALMSWIEGLGASGLDGRDLGELGLKNGNLTIDDQRNGKQWVLRNVDLSVTRSKGGGVALTVGSENGDQPWSMTAEMKPGERGHRIVNIETKQLRARDLMLAMRIGDGDYDSNLPLTGHIRADIGPDGMPRMIDGQINVEKGFIVGTDDAGTKISIDHAEFNLDWDSATQVLAVPFQIVSGGNRFTLLAQFDAPRDAGGAWGMRVTGGTIKLASATASDIDPLIINRLLLKLRIDPTKQRVDIEQGELGNGDLGLALSGNLDFSSRDPRLAIGIAGNRMSVAAMKRLWPTFISPKVRAWVEDHIRVGTVDRISVATNATLSALAPGGAAIPDDGLSIEIVGSGAEIDAVEGLPPIRDADLSVRISGHSATINLGRGNIEISRGRKLSITNGVFEVPDTSVDSPPARTRFRLDGSVPAAAELLNLDRLREFSGSPLSPDSSRGTLSAQVSLGLALNTDLPPGSSIYSINMDVSNFAAERLVMGQKVEATSLRVSANNQGYAIKGDVKINGVPASLDYRKQRANADAEIHVAATLDDAARAKFGFDVGSYISGPVPIKINGSVPLGDGDGRYNLDADLTQARVNNLLPGWSKPAGRAAHANLNVVTKAQQTHFDDIVLDAPGASVRGTLDLGENGDVVAANFPVFNLSDGDKTTLKADRGPDGVLRVAIRGEVYDGRSFMHASMAGPSTDQAKQQHMKDVDLDIKLGTVVGNRGETLSALDLKLSRRGGVIKAFNLTGKIGRGAQVLGDLRGRSNGRQVIYFESADAGAFFRFSDIYPKIVGGEMWVAMDPPNADMTPQEGVVNVRDFAVRGEASLDRLVANEAPAGSGMQAPGVQFSRMKVEYTRALGRFSIREGIVKGPAIGATVEGYIDYFKDDVRMRGTFIPLYGINNIFGQIPVFGQFLGGSNEGLLGVTYEVVGPPGSPTMHVNPVSPLAPGLLRKFFEFPTGAIPQTSYTDPNR